MIDIGKELALALLAPEVQRSLQELVREAVRNVMAGQGDNPDQLLDAKEAAALLGISVGAVQRAACRGSIPHVRIGRRLRFRRVDLQGRADGGPP